MEDSLFNVLVVILTVLSIAGSWAGSQKKKRQKQRGNVSDDATAEEPEWEIPTEPQQFPYGRPFVIEAIPEPDADTVIVSELQAEPFATREEEIEELLSTRENPSHSEAQTPRAPSEKEEVGTSCAPTAAFDLKQAVIWSVILQPKFDEQ